MVDWLRFKLGTGCGLLAVLVFTNTLQHQFVYDDRPAIIDNSLVVGQSSIASLLKSDFWGVPLSHTGSHKSYRPLTSLTFRLNWLLSGSSPFYFHATNIFLHGLVTFMFVYLVSSLVPENPALSGTAGVIFAVHPIHTEAVAGVVGRADLLCATFFLFTLLTHLTGGWSLATPVFATASMLSKEQGVTVLGVCFVIDLFRPSDWKKKKNSLMKLATSLVMIASIRAAAMGGSLPTFSKADNPASHSSSRQTRALTFFHLPVINLWLLICPSTLSYDWSMQSIPLITSFMDLRNFLSILFYFLLMALICPVFFKLYRLAARISWKSGEKSVESNNLSTSNWFHTKSNKAIDVDTTTLLLLSLSLLILPFLPATNLFFYVGFVVAERLLYIPSMGYCLLVALGLNNLSYRLPFSSFLLLAPLLLTNTARTISRNRDWATEETLFKSGVNINAAKSFSNLGNVLYANGQVCLAETAFKEAISHRFNMGDTHYNLGILLQNQPGRELEAVVSYQNAIQFRPQLAVAYLNLGVTYANIGREGDAIRILEKCSKLDDNGLKDPQANANARILAMFHLAKLLLGSEKVEQAISVLHSAARQGGRENVLNLLGEAHQQAGRFDEAEHWYSQSLQLNPQHVPAHLTLAKMLAKNESREEEAEIWFQRAKKVSPGDQAVYAHYGLFLLDRGRFSEAASYLGQSAKLSPTNYDNAFNAAVAHREAGQLDVAEQFYRRAVSIKPSEAAGHMNLGALLHLRGKYLEAEAEYLVAWSLRPGDQATQINIQRLHRVMRGRGMLIKEFLDS